MFTYKRKALILLLLLFFIVSISFADYISIENIKNNKLLLTELIDQHYGFSIVIFFACCIVFINSPLPLAALIKILGGFFFGFYHGAFYNITATLIACLVGFAISRYAFKQQFEQAYYQRLRKIENEIEENGFYYFLTLRLMMLIPYFLINIIAGICRISFKKYFFSTLLGVIPSSLIYAHGGHQLEQINSTAELFKSDIVLSLVLIALISLIPLLIKKRQLILNQTNL